MKKILIGLLVLGSFSTIAQDRENREIQIINSTYPDQLIKLECSDVDCYKMSIISSSSSSRARNYRSSTDRSYELDKVIDITTDLENSTKKTGRTVIDCNHSGMMQGGKPMGAPCFGTTRDMLENSAIYYKEGRVFSAIGTVLTSPFGFLVDVFSTAIIFPVILNSEEFLVSKDGEITRKARRKSKRKTRSFKFVQKQIKTKSSDGVIRVKDRLFYKIYDKLDSL